jgi:hypothetical protein
MSDRQQIHDAVLRYCRGIDRLDMDLVRAAYHPDGLDHHTGFDGTVDEFCLWVEQGLRMLGGTMHLAGNHLSEIHGDHAVAETYVTAHHWGPDPTDDGLSFTTGARYVDHFERREGRWAITERWAVREWLRRDRMKPQSSPGLEATRDADDPLPRLRARLL